MIGGLQLSPAVVLQRPWAPRMIWIILVLPRCTSCTNYVQLLSCATHSESKNNKQIILLF